MRIKKTNQPLLLLSFVVACTSKYGMDSDPFTWKKIEESMSVTQEIPSPDVGDGSGRIQQAEALCQQFYSQFAVMEGLDLQITQLPASQPDLEDSVRKQLQTQRQEAYASLEQFYKKLFDLLLEAKDKQAVANEQFVTSYGEESDLPSIESYFKVCYDKKCLIDQKSYQHDLNNFIHIFNTHHIKFSTKLAEVNSRIHAVSQGKINKELLLGYNLLIKQKLEELSQLISCSEAINQLYEYRKEKLRWVYKFIPDQDLPVKCISIETSIHALQNEEKERESERRQKVEEAQEKWDKLT